jgi:hypothetical protein
VKEYPNQRIAPLSNEAEAEDYEQRYDNSKAERAFDMKFRTFGEMLKDYAEFAFSYSK